MEIENQFRSGPYGLDLKNIDNFVEKGWVYETWVAKIFDVTLYTQ